MIFRTRNTAAEGRKLRRAWRPLLIGLSVLLLLAVVSWNIRIVPFAYHWIRMQISASEWRDRGVWLPGYRVAREAVEVEGLERNVSGLTYSSATGTLFTVINRPASIAELTVEGVLLRSIPLEGLGDPEGITHVAGDLFVISDESDQSITWATVGPETRALDLAGAPRLALNFDTRFNLGFEGISWDAANERLFVVQEMLPARVLTISGLGGFLGGGTPRLEVGEWAGTGPRGLFLRDLSSITVHEPTGQILLLSDMSAMLAEYAPDGVPVSVLPMWGNFYGLSNRVPQAEGVAVGPQGEIFVVSEPNLFYRFERTRPAHWLAAD